ncbi:MAG TPA: FGGY family carbohydrate kinase, partial [Anaerolineales bacterium]|nr:FGGY family carbohydrate kinase [Anaerolineales bacterium]
MAKYVAAVDQGTTSTRFMIFDHAGKVVALDQKEHEQIFPKPGWVEHNAIEIWQRTQEVIDGALKKSGVEPKDIAAVGIT